MPYVLSCDPGKTGGTVILDPRGVLVKAYRFDGRDHLDVLAEALEAALMESSETCDEVHAVVESVHAMPGQGVVSMFSFGRSYGEILGFLRGRGMTPVAYPPQTWQRGVRHGAGESPKDVVREFCKRQWGLEAFTLPGCRVPHQGAMDAAVMGLYHLAVLDGTQEPPKPRPKAKRRRAFKAIA